MAIARAAKERPALMLLDLAIPKLDGLAVIQRLREIPNLHDVPVVFLSAPAESYYRNQAMAAGGNDYITKPFDMDQLVRVLEQYVPGKTKTED